MQLAHVWSKFRALPVWLQVIAWILAAPAVAALAILARNQDSTGHRVTAGAVLVVGGLFWAGGYAGAAAPTPANDAVAAADLSGDELATEKTDEPTAEARPSPSPSPSPKPKPSPAPKPSPTPAPQPVVATWTVTNVVDGDTLDVRSADGTEERIRIVGIDTPERGDCGYKDAAVALGTLVMGKNVTLVAGARDDRDRYDRLLRYVDVGTTDAGLSLIEQGLAIARYDSRDGYGAHPREAAYVAADVAADDITCAAPPPPPPAPAPEPEPEPEPAQQQTYYKNCTEAREAGAAPVRRGDPGYHHHLDRDGDGVGCE